MTGSSHFYIPQYNPCKIKHLQNVPTSTINNLHINSRDLVIISEFLKEVRHSIHEHIAQFNNTPLNLGFKITSLRQKGHNHMFFYWTTFFYKHLKECICFTNEIVNTKCSNNKNICLVLYYNWFIKQSSVMLSSTRVKMIYNCYQGNCEVTLHVNYQAV